MDSASTFDTTLNVGSNAEFIVNRSFSMTKAITIEDGGNMTHDENDSNIENILNLNIPSLTVESNATVNVDAKGHDPNTGPGDGTHGASHGGQGGDSTTQGPTYGSILAPTNAGSGGNAGHGGGVVILDVTGTTALYGDITANGQNLVGNWLYTGSGGSVYLTTAGLMGNGGIQARGGDIAGNVGGGGGGRIAVRLTGTSSFGDVGMSARGGLPSTGGASSRGGAGTIYRAASSQDDGDGVVWIDNESNNTTRATYILPEVQFVTQELERATVVVTNTFTRLDLWTNTLIGDIVAYDDVVITLGSHTLFVNNDEHHLDDRSEPDAGGPTNVVDNYGQIDWLGNPFRKGTLLEFM